MPVANSPLRVGSDRYQAAWRRHNAGIAQWGVAREPTEELRAAAEGYAEALWEKMKWSGTPERTRTERIRRNRIGIIGAELFAAYFGCSADWTVYEDQDRGWDVQLRFGVVDVKTTRGFLGIRRVRMTGAASTPAYYGLVQHLPGEQGYTLCGVITPEEFLRKAEPMEFDGALLLGVTAFELQGLPYLRTR